MDETIRLRLNETVTNKLDGTQQIDAFVVDPATGRRVEGIVGATTELTSRGRILILQLAVFGHEIHERTEAPPAEDTGGVSRDQ